MQNFTNEELLLYIYNELKGTRKADLEKELENNWSLREKLQVFTEAKDKLLKTRLSSPRKQTIDAILQYAHGVSEVVAPR
jgi:hypothetical protein